jgi:hypothetical protein
LPAADWQKTTARNVYTKSASIIGKRKWLTV